MPRIEKITSNIYVVGGDNSAPEDAAVYLITDGTDSALIDAGTGRAADTIIQNIKNTGTDPETIKLIFLTHCHYDHTGGASVLRKLTSAKTVMHKLDASYVREGDAETTAASWYGSIMPETPVDIIIKSDNEIFRIGGLEITAWHTPGHSPGSIVLTMISDGMKILFGQDVHGPIHPALKSDREKYKNSLELMAALNADILCEGHYGIIQGKDQVSDFIKSFL
jgi:glyoxylase-like metal-dependent hydrolase (beta-lactamase superfamily II)